jgi:hypothetical protein
VRRRYFELLSAGNADLDVFARPLRWYFIPISPESAIPSKTGEISAVGDGRQHQRWRPRISAGR